MTAEDILLTWGRWARVRESTGWPSETPISRLRRYGAGAVGGGSRAAVEPAEAVLTGERLVLAIGREHPQGDDMQAVLVAHFTQPGPAPRRARSVGMSLRTYYRRLNEALAWCDRELEVAQEIG